MKPHLLNNISQGLLGLFPLVRKKLAPSPINDSSLPLSNSNYHALFLLHEMRHSTVSELSRQLNISRPNMTPLLDKLVKYDLVSRKTGETDRRVVEVEITPQGDELVQELGKRMALQIKEKLSNLSEADLMRMNKCLDELKCILLKVDHPAE
ncbi:MarR family transcriptional regulator [Paenibacillus sp. P96]|uniref:MarR family transcriptional regulator n=1 Tax=Paenibacillus zeirhizosphaerae TaxID=2987519 RepID=A0ABT9FW81_9BACL|nr:MarR family transcriptional regulator [Paenibacillus sp. P96]MDP4098885.1 MarR family transcriptional regulator [Paenibacillus sp. P96]